MSELETHPMHYVNLAAIAAVGAAVMAEIGTGIAGSAVMIGFTVLALLGVYGSMQATGGEW